MHFAKIGFGSATYADIIREGSRLGNKVGIYEVDQPIITTEIRTRERLNEIKDTLKKL